ncbi:MAG: hypothetical protein H6621_10160 [Halobacteriovoraceae bacterium]|nr:hypothetical protein [Halobacteriovoraceae bacterium]MCB9095420.1 hypothetical protein [Halobacteriovoraceae bacterium]
MRIIFAITFLFLLSCKNDIVVNSDYIEATSQLPEFTEIGDLSFDEKDLIDFNLFQEELTDNSNVTFQCIYDTSLDNDILGNNLCDYLGSAINSSSAMPKFDWVPDYDQSGQYEFKIIISNGKITKEKVFTITVNNVDAPPELDTVADATVTENVALGTIDINDGGNDTDIDGDAITSLVIMTSLSTIQSPVLSIAVSSVV